MRFRIVVALRGRLRAVRVGRLRWQVDGDILRSVRIDDADSVIDENVVVRPANHLIHPRGQP